MVPHRLLLRASMALLTAVIFAQSALAALPPLTPEQRIALAAQIVSGEVQSISGTVQNVPGGQDTVYRTKFLVTSVLKGPFVQHGQTITIGYSHIKSRLPGWTGPIGQYVVPQVGQHAIAYLTLPNQNVFELLEPNGIDIADSVLVSAAP